ncbi:hypothetical protein WR25_00310 [Diploscapter pachys]|uniref:HTH arsR-type domain-containing protein n=1 Tax=Diploscapter pachys TaxID=2018661 RepID=A0A2A2KL15_9BILA|nr:hypothetical protein WR25_00310 [Diploscapter pachys]
MDLVKRMAEGIVLVAGDRIFKRRLVAKGDEVVEVFAGELIDGLAARPLASIPRCSSAAKERSVVSRHLQVLHDAQIVKATKVGRQVFYEVNGGAIVERLEGLLQRTKGLVSLCCP